MKTFKKPPPVLSGIFCSQWKPYWTKVSTEVTWINSGKKPNKSWAGEKCNLACVSQKTRKLLGPEDFSGLFSGEFLGSRKAFLNAPENTPDSHPSFSGCFLGFAARAWQWFVKNLNWHGCTELGSSRTLQIKPSFVDSFVESQANFWLFLSFVQFQHRLLYFDWSLLRM